MPLIELTSGDVARANDVNNNFNYVMSLLGSLSDPTRMKTTTEYLMGVRQNTLFTGTHDTGGLDTDFFQIGYNADWNYSPTSGTWKFQRFITKAASPSADTGASALRLGPGEIDFLATSSQEGNLNSEMKSVFKIKLTSTSPSTDYIVVPNSIHFQNVDEEVDDELDAYRLMYTPFLSPNAIYDGQALNVAETVKRATDYGVSSHAKAISISCHVLADAGSDAQIKFYQDRSSPSDRFGFIVTALAGKRGSGWGIVPLGVGARMGQFYISRDANFDAVSAYVVGYWV